MKLRSALILLTLGAAACSSETTGLTAVDAGVPKDAALADASAGPKDAQADAGGPGDAAPLDAGAVRRLVDAPFFGSMPIENLVHDPEFDPTIFAWYAFSESGQFVLSRTESYAQTPTGQPVLRVPGQRRGGAVVLVGSAKGSPTRLQASVWLGRRTEAPEPSVAIAGVSASRDDLVFEIGATGEPAQVLDGITWNRYSAVLEPGTAGWLDVAISNSGSTELYVTGMWVVPTGIRRGAAVAPLARSRPATAAEKVARGAFAREQKKKLGVPRTRPLSLPVR